LPPLRPSFHSMANLTLSKDYSEACEKLLFSPIVPDTTQAFVLFKGSKPQRIVEADSLKDLLLQTIPESDKEHFSDFTEESSRKFLTEVLHTSDPKALIPIQVNPASYALMTLLGLIITEEEDLEVMIDRVIVKFKLGKPAQARLRAYATTSAILEDLLTKKKSVIDQLFSEEGLEAIEKKVITAKPWNEAYELFAKVWREDSDSTESEKKQVYRDLGYTKDPKKTPEENKKALAGKFKAIYEKLALPKRKKLSAYLESDEATLAEAKGLLGI